MPEIWLNYGTTEVVLDIMTENLARIINSNTTLPQNSIQSVHVSDGADGNADDGANNRTNETSGHNMHDDSDNTLDSQGIAERLGTLDLLKPFDLILMHDSQAVRRVVSSLFTLCEQQSAPFPGILADKHVLSDIKAGLPEGSVASEFVTPSLTKSIAIGRNSGGDGESVAASTDPPSSDGFNANLTDLQKRNLVFVAETEFDGLFGYETVATRLLRKFGADEMLAAYAKRDGSTPSPGKRTKSLDGAMKFVDRFEVDGIDIVATADGISDIFAGHPSATASQASSSLESHCIIDVAGHRQKTVMVSTGKTASSMTLGDSLSSVWNTHAAVRNNGLCMLIAECSRGLGSAALQMYVEGRLQLDHLNNPSTYIDGMEDLLFLSEIKKRCQIALVSVLPELYTSKFGIVSITGMAHALEYVKNTQGARHKSTIVVDGSRLLLR